jgi:hypothetical protein
MGQLDEVSHSIGRIEGKLDSLMNELVSSKKTIADKIETHDNHLTAIQRELSEKRGANHVMLAVYSFCMIGFWKILEHLPSLLK